VSGDRSNAEHTVLVWNVIFDSAHEDLRMRRLNDTRPLEQSDRSNPWARGLPGTSFENMSGKPAAIRVDTYDSWPSLTELLPAWEEILAENPALSIFSTPEWLGSWWEAFGRNRKLAILAFSETTGKLLGLVPLYWETSRHPLFGRLKQLRLLGDGSLDSDNLDLILRPGSESVCVAELLRWIERQAKGAVCRLNTLPGYSLSGHALSEQLASRGWPVRQAHSPNSVIPLPAKWESYVESLSPKFRQLIRRCARLMSQRNIRLRRCESARELPQMLNTLFSLHQKRWTSVNEPGSFVSVERRNFYHRMAKAFLERGWLELWTLEFDGKPVAAQMNFRYRQTVYALQEGFDPELAVHQIGYVLRAGMLERFIRLGITHYDFLGGLSETKRRWGARPGTYLNFSFAAPWSIAGCYLALDKSAARSKEWLRQHLPRPAWDILHRAKLVLKDRTSSVPSAIPEDAVLSE
jgi:CelD/BcsL family acetyltransferase involved in cellulose biosynthesis